MDQEKSGTREIGEPFRARKAYNAKRKWKETNYKNHWGKRNKQHKVTFVGETDFS